MAGVRIREVEEWQVLGSMRWRSDIGENQRDGEVAER